MEHLHKKLKYFKDFYPLPFFGIIVVLVLLVFGGPSAAFIIRRPTDTPTPTLTSTPTLTLTPSNTPTSTLSPTPSHTPTSTPTPTSTYTPTWTPTPTATPTPIWREVTSPTGSTRLYLGPVPDISTALRILENGIQVLVQSKNDDSKMLFVRAINIGEGWIELGSVASIPEEDLGKLPVGTPTAAPTPTLTATPVPTATAVQPAASTPTPPGAGPIAASSPPPTATESPLGQNQQRLGSLSAGGSKRLPLAITGQQFTVRVLFRSSSPDVTLDIIKDGQLDPPLGRMAPNAAFKGDTGTGEITWDSGTLLPDAKYEIILRNGSRQAIDYCLTAYVADDWDCK